MSWYNSGDDYRREYEAEKSRNSQLEREINELKDDVRSLERKKSDLEYDLEGERDEAKRNVRSLIRSHQDEIERIKADYGDIEEENTLLNDRLGKLEAENGDLLRELRKWRQMADEINAEWPGVLDSGDRVQPNPAKGLTR